MNRKSKIEIIEELFDNYFCVHPEKRAFDKRGSCTYLDLDTGNMCGVGMCLMTDEKNIGYQKFQGTVFSLENFLEDIGMKLDEVLKEEYRGHSTKFWHNIQKLHDCPPNWTIDGLSFTGIQWLGFLKKEYSGQ